MSISRRDTGLFLLRVGTGLSLCILFGLPKVKAAAGYLGGKPWPFIDFNRKIGLPAPVLVAYFQTLNESLGALLVACGVWTRSASFILFIGFLGATLCSLKEREASWITAAYLMLIFASIALTGPGTISIDRRFRDESDSH
jgi:uncharacterized membrane protein YphA (DoxX/SURF4 family)